MCIRDRYRRIAADGRGNCCGLTSAEIAVAIAADLRRNYRIWEDCRGNGRRWRWKLLWTWQFPRTSVVIAEYRRIAVAMAADGRGNCCGLTSADIDVAIAADFRGLPWLVPRSLPWTEPRHVPWPQPWHLPWKRQEPWPLPWKPADFHGSLGQHPRKSMDCLLYTSPSPRDATLSRMPSSA